MGDADGLGVGTSLVYVGYSVGAAVGKAVGEVVGFGVGNPLA